MTNDQQQVEAWRKEFMALNKQKMDTTFWDGKFLDGTVHYYWVGFLMAKRNQPVIELPDPDHYYLDDDVYDADQVHAAIRAAGYSYKVK